MKNKILFRFRDTEDVDTVFEHQNLIREGGYTWWGWWKKDSEPDRTELLDALKGDIDEIDFFFFDRSTERFFFMNVEDIAFSNKKINSPNLDLTPAYYKNELLPLWIKVNSIKAISKEEFLNNFKIVPVIDHTFFTEEEITREFIDLKRANKRIQVVSDYILHLSDIHLGDDYGFPSSAKPNQRPLISIIEDYVKNDLRKEIGMLIVSGDISSRGNGDVLLREGIAFLDELCDRLNLSKDAVIIIPGNHDIPLQTASFSDYKHETTYRIFLREFYKRDVEPFGLNFFEFPCGKKVDLLRIHSVKLRKKEESNYGYVDWFHYKSLLASSNLDGDIRFAVIHHHLVSVPIEETLDPNYAYASISVTIDSGRVIEGLQKHGFHFVLNGHQHIPGITKLSRGMINEFNQIDMNHKPELTILSAGSAGVKPERFSEELKYNSFSIYEIKAESLEVDVRCYNPSVEPKKHYSASLKIS